MIKTNTIIIALILLLCSCKKETETLTLEVIKDYYPLQIGQTITYKLDSTVYLNLSTEKTIHSYIVQDKVESMIMDNLGRPSYKIKRLVRSKTDSTKWIDQLSYLVTFDDKKVELIQDNLRFVKLNEPILNGFSWKGNSYINTTNIPEFQFLNEWQYEYAKVKDDFLINGITYPETITVNQHNDSLGTQGNKKFYYEVTYSNEVYAKKIGLIYKEFLHEIWQPSNINSSEGYYEATSYGIKLSIIGKNY